MQISKENYEILRIIQLFEKRIERMHQDFYRYYNGIGKRLPDWESLERELLIYSKNKIFETQLSNNLERVLYKFQNRKKIWLKWVDEYHHNLNKKKEKLSAKIKPAEAKNYAEMT